MGQARQNTLVVGPTGAGKTFVACAVANAACRQGFSARYFRVPRLLTDLTVAGADGSYPRFLTRLAKIHLLILDDWGLAPLSSQEARDALEIIDDRAEERNTPEALCLRGFSVWAVLELNQ